MSSIWVESLGRNFESALGLLESAIRDCTDELWEASTWEVPARDADADLAGPNGTLVTDHVARHALVQRHSTPWSIAWHALEVLDYEGAGEFAPWAPPPPFTGKAHWRELTTLPSAWLRAEMLGHVDYCRQRVRDTLSGLTEEKAATLLPPPHRYHGQPFAWELTALPLHTVEHASQIPQLSQQPNRVHSAVRTPRNPKGHGAESSSPAFPICVVQRWSSRSSVLAMPASHALPLFTTLRTLSGESVQS